MPQVDIPEEVQTTQEELGSKEMGRFKMMFERGLEDTYVMDTQVVVEKLQEYKNEILTAARIARAQFGQPFGGANPERGQFAVSKIRAGYFGYDSWENNSALTGMTAGAPVNFINDGAPDNLNGTDTSFGNPLKVGENAVHAVLGFGSYAPSPKISALSDHINSEPRATVQVKQEWTKTDLQIKWLDSPRILPEDALYEVQAFPDVAGDDAPYLVGLSFVESRDAETLDPANMTDDTSSTSDNIVAQG